MLTIFTIPKAFAGHIGVIQRNAIASWLHLRPAPEIVLCGDDPGVAETAAEFGVRHLPQIERNAFGTPLLSSAFEQVQALAGNELICYVNADILLTRDLSAALVRMPSGPFLLLGRRWDLDVGEPIDFDAGDWESRLREDVGRRGQLHPPAGSDYFVFPRGSIGELPPFAVGRVAWDNWFIYHARALGMPVIDATEVVMIVHQNHDYAHVAEARRADSSDNPEGDHNLQLLGSRDHLFLLTDATHRLTKDGLEPAIEDAYLTQRLQHQYVLNPGKKLAVRARRLLLLVLRRRLPYVSDNWRRRLVYRWSG